MQAVASSHKKIEGGSKRAWRHSTLTRRAPRSKEALIGFYQAAGFTTIGPSAVVHGQVICPALWPALWPASTTKRRYSRLDSEISVCAHARTHGSTWGWKCLRACNERRVLANPCMRNS